MATQQQQQSYFQYYVKGGISGMFGVFLSHPVDTVKTHIQTGKPFSTFNPTIKNFYRGFTSPFIGVCVEKAIVFGTYNYFLKQTDNIPISGGISGLTASFIVTPYERLKILKQNSQIFKMSDIDFRFLFKGLSTTFTREVPGFAIYFTTYEALKYHTFTKHGQQIEYINSFVYGGISGIMSWIFIYPQDRIKTIIQSQTYFNNNNTKSTSNFKNVAKQLWANGGIVNLYKGFSWALARATLLHSGTFCMMEILNTNNIFDNFTF
jgi:solute carrier family 25 carnitine/acylcarnitine transporter 20/29